MIGVAMHSTLQFLPGAKIEAVIASVAKQSSLFRECRTGLPRRFAPRNDGEIGVAW